MTLLLAGKKIGTGLPVRSEHFDHMQMRAHARNPLADHKQARISPDAVVRLEASSGDNGSSWKPVGGRSGPAVGVRGALSGLVLGHASPFRIHPRKTLNPRYSPSLGALLCGMRLAEGNGIFAKE